MKKIVPFTVTIFLSLITSPFAVSSGLQNGPIWILFLQIAAVYLLASFWSLLQCSFCKEVFLITCS